MKNYNALLCDTDEILAEDSQVVKQSKMKRKAKEMKHFGDVTGCTKIVADNNKLKVYVKPNQDINERLEHYRVMYPDAKIVK